MTYPKRLIEVDLPIKRISAHARREKSIRHGHISTLHIWWARRPLAACRAVLCASLWPAPEDPACPPAFREVARTEVLRWLHNDWLKLLSNESMPDFIAWQKEPALLDDDAALQRALFHLIADFANWDNSTREPFLSTARTLTQAAHEALGGLPGTRPLVVDPFAGGGAIPLEALRVGADAFASDLNPVAVLLNKVVLEYIPKYGQRLADEVRKWGEWIRQEAEKELAPFYPKDADGATSIAYLWARTIRCEGPGCGAEVPLIRNLQLTRQGRQWYLQPSHSVKQIGLMLREGTARARGTVSKGNAICPICNYVTPAGRVRHQLSEKRGGVKDARLLAVYVESNGYRYFREPTWDDEVACRLAQSAMNYDLLPTQKINPIRPHGNSRGLSAVTRIGMTEFRDLYNPRQALTLLTLQRFVMQLPEAGSDADFHRALVTTLHFVVSRFVFQNCAISRWNASRTTIEGAFGKQALQVVWDFAEANPLSTGSANWNNALGWVLEVFSANRDFPGNGTVSKAKAQSQSLPDESVNAVFTDPPYFAAIPYADLSNVFYVWERTLIEKFHAELFTGALVDQQDEIIVTDANRAANDEAKSPKFFQREMTKALTSSRTMLRPEGIAVVVFADSKTESWESILGALIDAGYVVTSSWPIDTELQTRTQAHGAASLQSSIHIVSRPREDEYGQPIELIGDWRNVLHELPPRIHSWLPRLAADGVVGADAIFACLGPALEIFSRYSRVEKASGEVVTLGEYLEHVWAAVSREALAMVFEGADTAGFEEDARLTAMWLWTLSTDGDDPAADAEDDDDEDEAAGSRKKASGGYALEYDAARKIAQGLGAHLETLGHLVEVKGGSARLLPVRERTRYLFGREDVQQPAASRRRGAQQASLFAELAAEDDTVAAWLAPADLELRAGRTTLDRVHQAMVLFGAGRSDALRRLLVDEGAGRDERLWRLAQALSALYPAHSEEKRWVDGVLARKKGLGL